MKKYLTLVGLAIALAACNNQWDESKSQNSAAQWYEDNPIVESSSSSSSEEASSSSVAPSLVEQNATILVDQSFHDAAMVTGMARLKEMKTVKLTGNIGNAVLHVKLSRNGQTKGVAGVSVYSADLMSNGSILPETEWKRFRFLGANWQGRCVRVLHPDSDLQSGKGETVEKEYDLSDVPFTDGDDGCSNGSVSVDLQSKINDTGIVLGFYPSNPGYRLTVTVVHSGDLVVENL